MSAPSQGAGRLSWRCEISGSNSFVSRPMIGLLYTVRSACEVWFHESRKVSNFVEENSWSQRALQCPAGTVGTLS